MQHLMVNGLEFRRRGRLIRICELAAPWYDDIKNPDEVISSLKKAPAKLDIFSFFQRVPHIVPKYDYHMECYSVSVLSLTSYDDWRTKAIGQNTRYWIKRADRNGVQVRVVPFDDEFVRGISAIYNETSIRQGKKFPHYNDSLDKVRRENSTYFDRTEYLGAYLKDELVGFARIVFEEEFADILQFLAKISHRHLGVSNALMAKIVEVCAARRAAYIAYGEWDSEGLGEFKRHNGFSRMDLPRYYIPLSWTGAAALRLGLHRGRAADLVPAKLVPVLRKLRRKWYELLSRPER